MAKAEKVKREPSRSCSRLNGSKPEFNGLADDYNDNCDGVCARLSRGKHLVQGFIDMLINSGPTFFRPATCLR